MHHRQAAEKGDMVLGAAQAEAGDTGWDEGQTEHRCEHQCNVI